MAAILNNKLHPERSRVFIGLFIIFCAFIVAAINAGNYSGAQAACTPLASTFGTVTNNVTVSAPGTYRIWVRVKTSNPANNSVAMQVDNTACNVNLVATGISANTWAWVGSVGGVASNMTTESLSAGQHTIVLAGKADGVMVDRVILTQNTACVPTGTGDNCAYPPDTTHPTVSITAPGQNANVSGTVSVTAVASDDVGISKVEFYVDGALKSTDTSAPYSYQLVTSSLSKGTHRLTAKAYDTSNNSTTSAVITVNVGGTGTSYKPADINQDGHVNLLDFSLLASNFNKSANSASNRRADINGDGVVNLLDFSMLASQFGK